MEVLKETLIKEVGNLLHDKVIFIENLPKKFLYEKTIRMVQRIDRDGYSDGTLVPDPDGEMQDTLLPPLEKSATGDNGIVFWVNREEAANRLKDMDRYINMSLPRDIRPPDRVFNTQQIGNASAGPIAVSLIPRLVLPLNPGDVQVDHPPAPSIKVPVKKAMPVVVVQSEESPDDSDEDQPVIPHKKMKRGMSEENRQKARERMKAMVARRRQERMATV